MKEIIFLTNMSELGAGTRGASLGFKAMEMASLKFGKRLFSDIEVRNIESHNDFLYKKVETPYAKHIEGILMSSASAGVEISKVFNEKKIPFVISGDHCNAASTIYGIKKHYPEKRLGVIWIDAHGDLHSPYTSPSGNMHGMPLAISLGEDNLPKQRNDITSISKEKWEELKKLGGIHPKIHGQDIVFFGVRDTESPEDFLIDKYGIRNFKVDELRFKGVDACIKEAFEILDNCDILYISFDVDAMDCDSVSRGTGTPVENGFTPEESEAIISSFIVDPRMICFEMVEINPLLDDKKNTMAETAVRILDNIVRLYTKDE